MTTSPNNEVEWGTWAPDAGSFGARLLVLRHAMGWHNVAAAARACGIPVGTWRQWEKTGTAPRNLDSIADKITAATGINQLWIMTGRVLADVETFSARPESNEALGAGNTEGLLRARRDSNPKPSDPEFSPGVPARVVKGGLTANRTVSVVRDRHLAAVS